MDTFKYSTAHNPSKKNKRNRNKNIQSNHESTQQQQQQDRQSVAQPEMQRETQDDQNWLAATLHLIEKRKGLLTTGQYGKNLEDLLSRFFSSQRNQSQDASTSTSARPSSPSSSLNQPNDSHPKSSINDISANSLSSEHSDSTLEGAIKDGEESDLRLHPGDDHLLPLPSIFSLGIGSPINSKNAQIQLAFLILIKDRLESTLSTSKNWDSNPKVEPLSKPIEIKVEIYDPIFTSQDTLLLEKGLGFTCLKDNKVGNHSFKGEDLSESVLQKSSSSFEFKTFIYMPHCPRTLYENFLRSNWNKESLNGMLFCWNDLRGYADRLPESQLERESPCIFRLIPYLKSYQVPTLPSPFNSALNDLAFQHFDPDLSTSVQSSEADTGSPQVSSQNGSQEKSELQVEDLISGFEVVKISKGGKRNRKKDRTNAETGIKKLNPNDDEFWILPPSNSEIQDETILPT